MNPLISVVMPTYNRADAIGITLRHLAQQTLPPGQFEVIVVDDGSSDDTEAVAMAQRLPFHLAYCKRPNRGAAAARNFGVSQARAALILFLDADVIPEPQLLEAHLHSHTATDSRITVGRVKPWPGTFRPWHEQIIDPESAGMDYGNESRTVPFYMALGGNFSIARQTFVDVGGYDEEFPAAGAEETEFAYRAEQRGCRLHFEPLAVGYHNHSRTLAQRCWQQAEHMRSMALLIVKHPELQTVIWGVDELMPIWSPPRTRQRVWQRTQASILELMPVRMLLYYLLVQLDRRRIWPRLAGVIYWRLSTGWRHAGFREGLRVYGHSTLVKAG